MENDIDKVLLPFQKKWIEDESKLKIWEKSRRIGASWTEALNAVLHSMIENGTSTYYMSYNKDMTRQFIDDCVFWCRNLQIAAIELGEEIIRREDEDFTVFRIRFASGCVIEALPSRAYSLRSKQGRIVLDEAAFTDEFTEVIKAGLALLIWGGSLTILSSHNGDDNPFNLLVKDIREGKEKGWSIHRVTFLEAVEQGLYRRICLKSKPRKEWDSEEEKEWIAEIRGIYKDNVEEELDVIPRRAGTKYFPRAMLDQCIDAGVELVRLNCRDDFMWERVEKREKFVRSWFMTEAAPILRSLEGRVFFGQDFARSGDLSFIWLAEEATLKDLDTRLLFELRNVPYDQQWQIIQLIVETVKEFGGMALDGRGNGQALAEIASQQYPGSAVCVMPSRPWYAEWFPKLKGRIESREWIIPDDEYILGDFGAVSYKNGVPMIVDRVSDRTKAEGGAGGARHGDGAIGAVLCLHAWMECSALAAPVVVPGTRSRANMFRGY